MLEKGNDANRSEKSAEAVVVLREEREGLNEKEWNPA